MRTNKQIIDVDFKLIKPLNDYKKGKIFKSFGGLVSGVEGINFLDKTVFKPVNIVYETN